MSASNLVSFDRWLRDLGVSRTTGWNWRRKYPWLIVHNVFGRLYITRESIAEFERKSEAGELSKTFTPPTPKKENSK